MTAEHIHQLRNRYRGALLGLACGDALGTTLEFHPPGTFNPLVTMIGGGPFRLKTGEWTDDTSMALCLGESLVECGGFEPVDQMQRYLRWWQDGYLSSTGRCFDVGIAVAAALGKYQNTGHPFAGSTDPRSAGNGSLTRWLPWSYSMVGRSLPLTLLERLGKVACAMRRRRGRERFWMRILS